MGKDTSVSSHQESTAESEIGPHTDDKDIHVEHNDELETQIIEYKKKIAELETQVYILSSRLLSLLSENSSRTRNSSLLTKTIRPIISDHNDNLKKSNTIVSACCLFPTLLLICVINIRFLT